VQEARHNTHLLRSPCLSVWCACRSAVHAAFPAARLLLAQLLLLPLPAAVLHLVLLPAVAAARNCCASRLNAGPRIVNRLPFKFSLK
jgi:hypothetical protein